MPRRLGIPLIQEIEPEDANGPGKGEFKFGITLDVLGQGHGQEIGEIDLSFLDHGHARGGLWHTFEDEPLYVGHLAPVSLIGLHDDLNPWRLADKLVGPQADRTLLKGVIANLLNVLLGYDPGRPGGECVWYILHLPLSER